MRASRIARRPSSGRAFRASTFSREREKGSALPSEPAGRITGAQGDFAAKCWRHAPPAWTLAGRLRHNRCEDNREVYRAEQGGKAPKTHRNRTQIRLRHNWLELACGAKSDVERAWLGAFDFEGLISGRAAGWAETCGGASGRIPEAPQPLVSRSRRLVFRWDGGRGEAADIYLDNHSYR